VIGPTEPGARGQPIAGRLGAGGHRPEREEKRREEKRREERIRERERDAGMTSS
jgi:hypothetical protein